MKKGLVVGMAVLVVSLMLAGRSGPLGNLPTPAYAAADAGCTALGGSDGAGTCNVSAPVNVTGTITVLENLHLLSGAVLTVTPGAFVLNVGDSTHPSNLEMDKNSSIKGGGKNVTVNVPKGNMTMHGTPLAGTDKCGYPAIPAASLGAQITSTPAVLATTVTINVGNFPNIPPVGTFIMERCSLVDASNPTPPGGAGPAGAVVIKVGHDADLDGLVLSESLLSGVGANQPPGGGPITVQAGCKLTVSSTGVVSSKGLDPGADLVHLEGCDVFIDGLVQSTGPGHAVPNNPANHCASGVHSAKPANSTGCIEIIGQNITISNTAEINADINSTGSGGSSGSSWIDLFSYKNISITGRTGATVFSVHADTASGTDTTPNTVTAKAGQDVNVLGTFTGSGNILSASIKGAANGSFGGAVVVQASGAVNLDTSTVMATGDNVGGGIGPCDSGSGACGKGGTIDVRSFNSAISWLNGVGNVNPDNQPSPNAGLISLTACTTVTTTGTSFDNAVPTVTTGICGGLPAIPAYVDAAFDVGEPIWAVCNQVKVEASKRGKKFNDVDNSGSFTAGDTPIPNWPINLMTTGNAVLQTINTAADGTYVFSMTNVVAPTTFKVCEGTGPAGYVQTFPHGAPNATPDPAPGSDIVINTCPAPNVWGYQFTVDATHTTFSNDDFGNRAPTQWCEKQPVQAVLNPVKDPKIANSGQYLGNKGPDYLVHVNHGDLVQTAVNAAALADSATTGDINGDGFIIIAVTAHDDGTLGGSSSQSVLISANYPKPFALIGCSVTLTGGGSGPAISITSAANDSGLTITESAAGASHIFLMDLHGGSSGIGVKVDGSHRYLRNEEANDNTGAGFSITGDFNTMHNGTAGDKNHGNGGDGVYVSGNSNYLTDTNSYANGGNGFNVAGNSNQLLKLDAGDKDKGNGGDGIHVVGASNMISEPDALANGGDGIDVAGNSNTVTKAQAGDKAKGNSGDGIRIAGTGNNINQGKASANTLAGYDLAGGSSASPNILTTNLSNTGVSGDLTLENAGAEYLLKDYVRSTGGNKADSVAIPKTSSPTKCTAFPANNTTVNFAASSSCE